MGKKREKGKKTFFSLYNAGPGNADIRDVG